MTTKERAEQLWRDIAPEFVKARAAWAQCKDVIVDRIVAALDAERQQAAERIETLRRSAGACYDCGGPHWLDTSLPSEIWNQIASPDEMLCTACIDARALENGVTFECEFYWVGRAGRSRLYEHSYGDAQAKTCEAAALRARGGA